MKIKTTLILLSVLLFGCSSNIDIDKDIDEELDAYSVIQRDICPYQIKNFQYNKTEKRTNLSYQCGSSSIKTRITISQSVDTNLFSNILYNFVPNNYVLTYSGFELEEIILLYKEYFSDNTMDIKEISASGGGFDFSTKSHQNVNLIADVGDGKRDIIEMHEQTIDFLHKFQAFSCKGQPLKVQEIKWFKYAYNMSSAKVSCNGDIYIIPNYANDLNLEKYTTEKILFK